MQGWAGQEARGGLLAGAEVAIWMFVKYCPSASAGMAELRAAKGISAASAADRVPATVLAWQQRWRQTW